MKTTLIALSAAIIAGGSAQAGIVASWTFNQTANGNPTVINGTGSASVTGLPTLTVHEGGSKSDATLTGTTLKYQGSNQNGAIADLNSSTFDLTIQAAGTLNSFTVTYSVRNANSGPTDITWTRTGGSGTVTISVSPNQGTTPISGGYLTYTATFSGLTVAGGNNVTFTADFNGASGNNGSIEFDGVEINAVPEPTNIALGLFGAAFVGLNLGRRYLGKKSPLPVLG